MVELCSPKAGVRGSFRGLVWSLFVVNSNEVVEALLLLQEVEGGGRVHAISAHSNSRLTANNDLLGPV